MTNVPVTAIVTYLSYLRNCDNRVPLVRHSQKSGDLEAGGRITHTLGVISLDSLYAPTGVSEFSVKEAFYSLLQMVEDSCPKGDTLIVLGVFNATTGTDTDGNEPCVGPPGSGSRD